MFSGYITALVTPMTANKEVDLESLQRLVDRQIAAGVQALVVIGTTGEAPTLTLQEQHKVIRAVVEQANHRVPVIAGTGSYSTQQTIVQTKAAMELGVDGCLIITPYYNKPTQEGLYQHYKAVADAVPVPIVLYNIPGRTCCDMLPETIERLARIPNIVSLKQDTLSLARAEELLQRCGDRMTLLSGNDGESLPLMLLGFKGVVSVTSNVAPRLMQQMCQAALAGDKVRAREINQRLQPLHEKLFVETNPIPCKWLLQEMGLIPPGIRLPLTPLAEKFHDVLRPLASIDQEQ